jgi:hypothetical protein
MAATKAPLRSWLPKTPSRHGVPTAAVWATRGWLIVLGTAAIVVGGHDLLVATETTVRLWGTLVFGGGAVLIAGAIGLHHETPQGRALARVAALLGIALGLMTFLVQVVSDEPDDRLLLWGTIMALSAGALWVVHEVTPDEERGLGVWKQLPVLKSVVSVGVLISVGQFWYTAIYVPTTAPANLSLEPKLTQEVQGDRVVLRGLVTIRNTSGTRVNVLASYLDVAVTDAGLAPDDEGDFRTQLTQSHGDGQPLAVRYMRIPPMKSVMHGSPIPNGTYFEPGEVITREFLAWVPKGTYTFASATVAMTIARGRTLGLELAGHPPTSDGSSTVEITRIPDAGWLRSLTRGSRYVRVDYDDRDLARFPLVRFTPTEDQTPEDFNRRLWRVYGASTLSAETDIPIAPAR